MVGVADPWRMGSVWGGHGPRGDEGVHTRRMGSTWSGGVHMGQQLCSGAQPCPSPSPVDAAMAPPPEEHHLEMVPEGTSDVPWAPPEPEHPEQSLAKAF